MATQHRVLSYGLSAAMSLLFVSSRAAADPAWFVQYRTNDEITQYVNDLVAQYPARISTFPIGLSCENRPIHAIRLVGDGDLQNRPAILVTAGEHAREWIAPMAVLHAVDRLASSYDTDTAVQYILDRLTVYVVPVANPDGYVYSWTTDRNWQKTRRHNGGSSYGVAYNRNWRTAWGATGSSATLSDSAYRGQEPFSEPETRAMRDFVLTLPNLVGHADLQAYGERVLWPWAYTTASPPAEMAPTLTSVASQMLNYIFGAHSESYTSAQASSLGVAAGTMSDWMLNARNLPSWIVQLRPVGSTPGYLLPADQIAPTGDEVFAVLFALADWADEQVWTTINLAGTAPDAVLPGEPVVVDVEIVSVGESQVPDSATVYWRYQDGPFQAAPLAAVDGFVYRATLPAPDCGDTLEFYASVSGTASGVKTYPVGAPTDLVRAPAGGYVVVFADDFETDRGWTVENGPGFTDGAWERDVPSFWNRGDPPTDADGSGACYLTDNDPNSNNSDVDGGYTRLTSPVISLPSPEAVVRWSAWYTNYTGTTGYDDLFQVQVSSDGGTNWVPVSTLGPVHWAGWDTYSIRLSEMLPGASQVQIRFEATDLGAGSVVEAGVDGFSVSVLACPPPTAGDFDLDGDTDLADSAAFARCFGQSAEGTCGPGDLDGDQVVGPLDVPAFLNALEGPG